MRTDQLLSRVWYSLKYSVLQIKFLVFNLFALAGIALTIIGGYIVTEPYRTLASRSTLVQSLPAVHGLTTVDGGVLFVVGVTIALIATRT